MRNTAGALLCSSAWLASCANQPPQEGGWFVTAGEQLAGDCEDDLWQDTPATVSDATQSGFRFDLPFMYGEPTSCQGAPEAWECEPTTLYDVTWQENGGSCQELHLASFKLKGRGDQQLRGEMTIDISCSPSCISARPKPCQSTLETRWEHIERYEELELESCSLLGEVGAERGQNEIYVYTPDPGEGIGRRFLGTDGQPGGSQSLDSWWESSKNGAWLLQDTETGECLGVVQVGVEHGWLEI